MNYYFFLQAPGLDCEIGVANFRPDSRARDDRANYLCHATPAGTFWRVGTLARLEPREVRAVRPADLGLDARQAASTLLFLSPERLEGERDRLPRFPGFDSVPAWRANLKVIAGTTCASFQGEYPAGMLDIPRGSTLSLSAMLQGGPDVVSGVFFASFKADAGSLEASLDITRVTDGKLLKRASVKSNTVNFVDLADAGTGDAPALVAASSTGLAGIPIYLSRDRANRCLSLEHTHPPAELTTFGEQAARSSVVGRMREAWLRRLQHA